MNYFEFYGLPVRFHPDQAAVKQQFYALSKQYHPDFYVGQSAEKQEEVLALATLTNTAYQVLTDASLRLPYVLELKGVLVAGENYTLPQAFLLDMLEINEALMELEFEPEGAQRAQLSQQVAELEQALQAEMDALMRAVDAGDASEATLAALKDAYYRSKYIQRIKARLSGFNVGL